MNNFIEEIKRTQYSQVSTWTHLAFTWLDLQNKANRLIIIIIYVKLFVCM